MINPLTTQTSFLAWTGELDFYRSGKAGQYRNDGDVRQINGFSIDVSGSMSKLVVPSSFTPGAGIKTVPRDEVPRSLLASSTLAASIQLQSLPNVDTAAMTAVGEKDGSAYVTSVGEVTELSFIPAGAEPQQVEGPGFLPDMSEKKLGLGEMADHFKRAIARSGELAQIESQLSQQYGVDVKVAFDPMAEEYVMLRPGQPGYDQVTSARDVFARVAREDVHKLGFGDYRDVLAQYGVVA